MKNKEKSAPPKFYRNPIKWFKFRRMVKKLKKWYRPQCGGSLDVRGTHFRCLSYQGHPGKHYTATGKLKHWEDS